MYPSFTQLIKQNGSICAFGRNLAIMFDPILSDDGLTCHAIAVSESQYDDGEFDERFSEYYYVAVWNVIDINLEKDEMCNWDSPLSVTHSACL